MIALFSDDANFYYQYPANVEIVELKDIKNSLEQLAK